MTDLVRDNGVDVTLDLHGLKVDHALEVFDNTIAIAIERGRSTLRVIHGSSTSSMSYNNRTIKHAIEEAVAANWSSSVSSVYASEDVLTLGLPVGARSIQKRITGFEVS